MSGGGEVSCGLLMGAAGPSLGLRSSDLAPRWWCVATTSGQQWPRRRLRGLCVRAVAAEAEVACFCPRALAWHFAGVFLGESLGDGDAPGRRFPC
jgi:hypothetical protein